MSALECLPYRESQTWRLSKPSQHVIAPAHSLVGGVQQVVGGVIELLCVHHILDRWDQLPQLQVEDGEVQQAGAVEGGP